MTAGALSPCCRLSANRLNLCHFLLDDRLDEAEFLRASKLVGVSMPGHVAAAEFAEMDRDGDGVVSFAEFCSWCARTAMDAASKRPSSREEEVPEQHVFFFGATTCQDVAQIVGRTSLETCAAVAPGFVQVFAGAARKWDGCSVATLIEPRPDIAMQTLYMPLRPPRSALLPNWQLPLREPDSTLESPESDVRPAANSVQTFGWSVRLTAMEVRKLDDHFTRENFCSTALRLWIRDVNCAPCRRSLSS